MFALCSPTAPANVAIPAVVAAILPAAVPGRRRATIDLAQEIERRGFAGL
jgi:hypothetical protein